jgi:hypothetical protein
LAARNTRLLLLLLVSVADTPCSSIARSLRGCCDFIQRPLSAAIITSLRDLEVLERHPNNIRTAGKDLFAAWLVRNIAGTNTTQRACAQGSVAGECHLCCCIAITAREE